jgi:cytochrome c oxidase subunit 2
MKKTIMVAGIMGAVIFARMFGADCAQVSAEQQERVIKMTAKKFEYSPSEITLKKGVPTILEITALDRIHGFSCPDLNIRADLVQGKVTRVRVVPQKAGRFIFRCDIFCGDGHEDMSGTIIVKE